MAIIDTWFYSLPESVASMVDALKNAESQNTQGFDWAGHEDIPCVAKPSFSGKVLGDDGGWERKRMVSIKFRVGALPDGVGLPLENHVIGYRASEGGETVRYRVDGVRNWHDQIIELICVDSNQ